MENNRIKGILPEWKNEIFINALKKVKDIEIVEGVKIIKCRYDAYHEHFTIDLENKTNVDNDIIQKSFYQIFARELKQSVIDFLKEKGYNPKERNKSIMFETSCNGSTIIIR